MLAMHVQQTLLVQLLEPFIHHNDKREKMDGTAIQVPLLALLLSVGMAISVIYSFFIHIPKHM